MQINHSDAAWQARTILGAWQTGNKQLLCEELARVDRLQPASHDSAEEERMELLSAIVGELQASNQPLSGDSSQVCRNLLSHLAYSGAPAALKSRATLPWGQQGYVPAPALVTVLH